MIFFLSSNYPPLTGASKREAVHVEHNGGGAGRRATSTEQAKPSNGHTSNRLGGVGELEETSYSGRPSTNLPQLGKIDYIYKTTDDQ